MWSALGGQPVGDRGLQCRLGARPSLEGLFLFSTSHPPEVRRHGCDTLGGLVSRCPGLNTTLSFRHRNSLFIGPSPSWESSLFERHLIDFHILGPYRRNW